MATLIAARKPYIRTETAENIYLTIKSYQSETPGDFKIFTVSKSTYTPGTPQPLNVDLSPFAFPLFRQNPQQTPPTGIEDPVEGGRVTMEVTSDLPTEYYDAYYGWELFGTNKLGVSSPNVVKNIFIGSSQYITADLFDCTQIEWATDTGKTHIAMNPNLGLEQASVFPVLIPDLGATNTDNTVTIVGKDGGGATLWTVRYNIECAWDNGFTVGFINRYGVWETFDTVGRTDVILATSKQRYQSASTGNSRAINSNGRRIYELNTGWVGDHFEHLLEDLLVSESIVAYSDLTGFTYLVSNTEDTFILNKRADGLRNYTLNFDQANKIIPVI